MALRLAKPDMISAQTRKRRRQLFRTFWSSSVRRSLHTMGLSATAPIPYMRASHSRKNFKKRLVIGLVTRLWQMATDNSQIVQFYVGLYDKAVVVVVAGEKAILHLFYANRKGIIILLLSCNKL